MPKVLEVSLEDGKEKWNPHSKEAFRILRQKKWRGPEFKRNFEIISLSPEIEENPSRAKDWFLHILYKPINDEDPYEHYHILFNLREMKEIRRFIEKLEKHIEGLKKAKTKRKRKKKS